MTQIELFFDLVFAFAVTQLSASLRAHLSAAGFVQNLILFGAVWWVWVYTAWSTNWLNPRMRPVRLVLVGLTFLGLVLGASLPRAFEDRGAAFAGAYVAMQIGRGVFMLVSLHGRDALNFRNLLRITLWFCIAAPFWAAGAALPQARLALWAVALGLEYLAPAFMFYIPGLGRSRTAQLAVDGGHLAERCGGFILLALGESITVAGADFYALRWSALNCAAILAAFIGIVALWWIYFDRAAERGAEIFAAADDRGRIARSVYTYAHGLLVAGIIGVAGGDGLLLANPGAAAGAGEAAIMLGGPALFLSGSLACRWLLGRFIARSHLWGLALLAAIALAAPYLTALSLVCAVSLALVAVAALGELLAVRRRSAGA